MRGGSTGRGIVKARTLGEFVLGDFWEFLFLFLRNGYGWSDNYIIF